MHDVFSHSWVAAWADEIRRSDVYRQASATWEGSIALEMTHDGSTRGAFLDLWHGECRAARAATDDDLAQADYVLSADAAIWKRVLGGQLEPILGLMSGQLKLRRGSLSRLTPYLAASRELVATASRVPGAFPDGL
jgi:putative sterol carrier protein